jgi:hypothetical protein
MQIFEQAEEISKRNESCMLNNSIFFHDYGQEKQIDNVMDSTTLLNGCSIGMC